MEKRVMETFFVYLTVKDEAEAKVISRTVVEERLAACANMLGPIGSIYWWEGTVCEGEEIALILKTSQTRKTALIDRIKELHSYDCPAIACLPIADGNSDFLEWIKAETAPPPR